MLEIVAVALVLLVAVEHRPRFTPARKTGAARSQRDMAIGAATFALMGVLIGFTVWVLVTQ